MVESTGSETVPFVLPGSRQGVGVKRRASEPGEADGRVWVTLGSSGQRGLDEFVSRRAGRIGLP